MRASLASGLTARATRAQARGVSKLARARVRRASLAAIAFLYAVSIPWYREAGAEPGSILGLPDWAAVALFCYAGVALLNSVAWWLADVPEGDEDRP